MGKVVKFTPDDGRDEKQKESGTKLERLTQKDLEELVEPFRNGLKKLYPSQVKDILGLVGFGEKRGQEIFAMGILLWQHVRSEDPIASTFIALFQNYTLEKVSFLEAKNNYWDWKIMIETYQNRFNTKEMFRELQLLREKLLNPDAEP